MKYGKKQKRLIKMNKTESPDIGEGRPCQCRFRNGTQVKECDFHKRQHALMRTRLAQFLEARIKQVFNKTYLYELKEEVIHEVERIRGKK